MRAGEMEGQGLRVLKFGGTSLATEERVEAVAAIIRERIGTAPLVVVVSAFGGVTDALAEAAEAAARRDRSYRAHLQAFAERHRRATEALACEAERESLLALVDRSAAELEDVLRGVSLVRECSARTLDSVLSHGELLSSQIVAAALRKVGVRAESCDARLLIATDSSFGAARVNWEATRDLIREHLAAAERLQIVTGFLGRSPAGETTTLGRGGSDYTASLIGAALGAEAVEIWTDVDGVMSADPRIVPNAFSIPALSYVELQELSHFGAKVVYPPTLRLAREHSIPLLIRNTLNPSFPGTGVAERAPAREGHPVRGTSSITRVALLRLEGDGLAEMRGATHRLFGTLARGGVEPLLITLGSSGHSLCFAVPPAQMDVARVRVEEEFALERRAGLIDELVVEPDCSVIAAVGEGMRETPGVSGRLFGVLGRNRVNVRAIAQGSSEFNISVVVAEPDRARALRVIHDAFFMTGARGAKVDVHLAGVGRVGRAFLAQLAAAADDLAARYGVRLVLAGCASSRAAAFAPEGIDPLRWGEALEGAAGGPEKLVEWAVSARNVPAVFVDCTASDAVAEQYGRLLRAGVSVVSANKRGFCGPLQRYRALRDAGVGAGLYFETTVCAGLPVLGTITDLAATGDRVRRIEAVLSGTLSYVFDRMMGGTAFHAAVREAHERGFTEPEPRDDLGGADVARKLVILARVAGFDVELECVALEPVLDGERWGGLPLADFWGALPQTDEHFRARVEAARARGTRLCYLARIEDDCCQVGVEEVGSGHPCWTLRGTDTLVAVSSDRYAETPLVIWGPGAGPEVTAGGLLADVLRAAREAY